MLGGLILRGDKIVLIQQVRSSLLLGLGCGLLLGLGCGLLLLSRERSMESGSGGLGLLLPIWDAIGTGAQSRRELLRRSGMQPSVIV